MSTSVCRRYDMDLRDERELAFQRLLTICQSGLVSITDFRSGLCPPAYGLPSALQQLCGGCRLNKQMLSG